MHYYQHHIGDFIKATARLSDSQAMAYLRLIWKYYDDERPLPDEMDVIAFQIGATEADVNLILRSYFKLEDDGWHQTRCDTEISEYHQKAEQASKAGKASAEARKNKRSTDVEQPLNGLSTNHKPLTNNQEPVTSNQSSKQRGTRLPDNWWPSIELESWAKAERPELDVGKTAEGFVDYWLSVPGQKGVKLDWDRTFKTWVRNQKATKSSKAENLKLTEQGERAVRVMDSWLKGKDEENGQAKIC